MVRVDIDHLKKRLGDMGWNQKKFSEVSGLSEGAVSRLFRGERKGSMQFLDAIMMAFPEDDINDFLQKEETRNEGTESEDGC